MSLAAAGIAAIAAGGNRSEASVGGFDPLHAALLLTFGLQALGFAFIAGGVIIAWLRDGAHDRLSLVALMTGLAVGSGSAFATIAVTPIGSPVLSDQFRLGAFLGLGFVVVATGSEAFRGLMEFVRERDWFRVAVWFVGAALLVGLLALVRR